MLELLLDDGAELPFRLSSDCFIEKVNAMGDIWLLPRPKRELEVRDIEDEDEDEEEEEEEDDDDDDDEDEFEDESLIFDAMYYKLWERNLTL